MRVDFYHLTTTPIERALPQIAERVLSTGERLVIVAHDEAVLGQLDEELWTFRADSFVPHGREGDQPVLLAEPGAVPPGYANIAIADGVWSETVLGFSRAFYFFDAASIECARQAWLSLRERDGVDRRYWKQSEAGRWVEGP